MSIKAVNSFILRAARKSDEMLEPYDGKLSRTVLRRESGSNLADLVDYYYRFITHLKFFAERIFSEKQIPTKEMDGLLELIREKYPQDVECVLDIAAFLKQRYGYTLSEEEILYLSIHVSRIHQVSMKGGEAV